MYRLENKTMEGSGKLNFSNVEGLAGTSKSKSVRDSITAAFNCFAENATKLVSSRCEDFDYSLYFNDLQNRGVSDEISVAEVVGLFSALSNRAVLPSLAVVGRVVMSGSMMPITTDLDELFVTAANAGAKKMLLPTECQAKYDNMSADLRKEITVIFYSTPLDAARKALGVE